MANDNGRSLAGVVSELKDEVKEFASTRVQMLKSEMKEKISSLKLAIPLIIVAALMGVTAWLVITGAFISVVAAAFYPSRYAYFLGFVIVGVVYLLLAAVLGAMGYREVKRNGLTPERTIRVLKEDQLWLQSEARQQV